MPYPKYAICYSGNKTFFKDTDMSLALDLYLRFWVLNTSPMGTPVIQHVQGNHSLHKSDVSALAWNSVDRGTLWWRVLLLQVFSATSQMFSLPLIKPLVLQRQKFILPMAAPHLKPQSCPAPLVLMLFFQANSAWPEKQHQGREWRVLAAATTHLSVASPSPPRCEGTHSFMQHHGQHSVLHPICFPSQYEHRLGLSSNPERTCFSSLIFFV